MIEIFDKCHCQIYIINALITFAPATTLEIGIGRRPESRILVFRCLFFAESMVKLDTVTALNYKQEDTCGVLCP